VLLLTFINALTIGNTSMPCSLIFLWHLTKSPTLSSAIKLSHYGINGQLISWIQDYLSDILMIQNYQSWKWLPYLTKWHWQIRTSANAWSMKYNPDKCVHLRTTNRKTFLNHNYTIYNQQLWEVPSAKYLGITIDSHLTWKDHVNEICS